MPKRRVLLLLSLVLSSCTIVDASLYKKAERLRDAGGDGSAVPGGDDASATSNDAEVEPDATAAEPDSAVVAIPQAPADECSAPNTLTLKDSASLTVDTSELFDDVRATEGCTGHAAPGNDAFLQLKVGVNEKWHFHLAAKGGGGSRVSNPSLYLTQACDIRQCSHFSDRCGDGADEHFTFIASAEGTWYLGIDDRNGGGGEYKLEAVRTTCGDGKAEHGEACDDGGRTNGDGCDNLCRKELSGANPFEVEANDDASEANMLAISSAGQAVATVSGRVAGCPNEDFFGVRVGAGESIRATILDRSQQPCAVNETLPAFELLLRSANGSELGVGATSVGNACPAIETGATFAEKLAEGAYFIVVRAPQGTDAAYQLRVEVVPAS